MAKRNALTRSKKRKAYALVQDNQVEAARDLYAQVCRTDPSDAEAWLMLGAAHGRLGDHVRAAEALAQAVRFAPENAQAWYNLGIALRESGDFEAALDPLRRALSLEPAHRDAPASLSHLLLHLGQRDEAARVLETAIRHRPRAPELHTNLGAIYQADGRLAAAERCHRQELQINPDASIVYDNLGTTLCAQGRFAEALDAYRQGLGRDPAAARTHSNLLLTLHYLPDPDPESIFDEHKRWGERHGQRPRPPGYQSSPDPDRRLRIGFVSPDLRAHSVAYFFEPLLERLDRTSFETWCYSDVARPDATTERLRGMADAWRDVASLPDAELARRIHHDAIDILIDMAGHTAGNRLLTFAHQPAPVQATWLGYPNTTGLDAIDYRISDWLADPEGSDGLCVEQLHRLDPCLLCYRPPHQAPAIQPSPLARDGFVTFGSFNNLAKINDRVIETWSELLERVPDSRLLVKNASLTDHETRQRYRAAFENHGVDMDRIELLGHTPGVAEHLALYGRVDIGLDTFPYNGTTTTCEALWMGLPVVTLQGSMHAGRVGTSLLNAIGRPELVAPDTDAYVEIARQLAEDPAALREWRASVRQRLSASPLRNEHGFARRMEEASREMWRRWCAGSA